MKHTLSIVALAVLSALTAGCISPELRTARISINENDWNRALQAVDRELARVPQSSEARYLKGFVYEKLNDYPNMSAWYDSSLAVSDQFADKIDESRKRLVGRYFQRAMTANDEVDSLQNQKDEVLPGRIEELRELAMANLDTCIIINPHEALLYRQGAVTAYYADQYDRALQYAERALALETTGERNLTVREVILAIYRHRKDNANTIKWARELMDSVNPAEDAETYLRGLDALVMTYVDMGEDEKAAEATQDAIASFPERVDLKKNLAVLMSRRQNYTAAAEIYRQVLEAEPNDFDANVGLGSILVTDKQWEEAIPYLERAHKLKPDNLVAVQNLMAAYFNSGQDQKGLEMKKKFDALTGGE